MLYELMIFSVNAALAQKRRQEPQERSVIHGHVWLTALFSLTLTFYFTRASKI